MEGDTDGLLGETNVSPSSIEINDRKKSSRVTIEPVIGAIFFAQCLSDSVLTELYLERTCRNQLKLNESICDSLGSGTEEGKMAESLVQPFTADYVMWKLILQSIVPAILSIFLGPWTDKNGRKPVLMFSVAGVSLMYASYVILSYLPNLHPAFILIGVIPLSLMGGYVNLISASYCYISDVSDSSDRSFRLAMLEGFLFIGTLMGLISGSYIFNATKVFGYLAIFGISAIVCFLSLIYLAVCVQESVPAAKGGFSPVFDVSLPLEMAKTCFRKRDNHRRAVIFLCMAALASCILIMEGDSQVVFLFTRLRFAWNLNNYLIFSAVIMLITIFGTILGCWLLPKYLHISDISLAVIAFSMNIVQCIIFALARPDQSYLLYVGGSVGLLRGVVGPVIRSVISQTVPEQDLGKVFALTSSLEALMPIAASPLYVKVYNATLNVLPGAFFFLSAALYAVDAVFMLIIAVIQKRCGHSSSDVSINS